MHIIKHPSQISMQTDYIAFNGFTIYNIRDTNLFVVLVRESLYGRSACLETVCIILNLFVDQFNILVSQDGDLPVCVEWTDVQCTCAITLQFNYCQNKPEFDEWVY
eukprot:GHVO01061672.1.p1 GENE.GHVO01061672.1~~GHVO01061672.1.p1  ORF type:complete len:106 (-),score=8.86 GHVO01061672.1:93-410(-)